MNSKILKYFVLFAIMNMFATGTYAQTYSYKYSHSVKDEVSIHGVPSKGTVFYFTFTNDMNNCYLTDKNGVYSNGYGQHSFKYIGKENGILIFKEQNQNMFRNGQSMLYFSSNFSKLNWRCVLDDYFPNTKGCLRVLRYISNPDKVATPGSLY